MASTFVTKRSTESPVSSATPVRRSQRLSKKLQQDKCPLYESRTPASLSQQEATPILSSASTNEETHVDRDETIYDFQALFKNPVQDLLFINKSDSKTPDTESKTPTFVRWKSPSIKVIKTCSDDVLDGLAAALENMTLSPPKKKNPKTETQTFSTPPPRRSARLILKNTGERLSKLDTNTFYSHDDLFKAEECSFTPQEKVFKAEECAFTPQDNLFKAQECSFTLQDNLFKQKHDLAQPENSPFKQQDLSSKSQDLSFKSQDLSFKAQDNPIKMDENSKTPVKSPGCSSPGLRRSARLQRKKVWRVSTELRTIVNDTSGAQKRPCAN